jgi:hypothetical protein
MQVDLTMKDLIALAMTSKLEKDGLTLTINRPILTEIKDDTKGSKTEVLFFLDETDPRSASQT